MTDATVRGIVHLVEETKTYGKNGFRKRLVVLEQDRGRYTNYVPLEFVQDSCETADSLSVGDGVEVTYRLSGRKWQRDAKSEVKYFLSAEATGLKILQRHDERPPASEEEAPPVDDVEDEEVPF